MNAAEKEQRAKTRRKSLAAEGKKYLPVRFIKVKLPTCGYYCLKGEV
jgi:hypothetical protein